MSEVPSDTNMFNPGNPLSRCGNEGQSAFIPTASYFFECINAKLTLQNVII